jgi:DNA-directed RNA polymerase subunit RPC12/RpoP
MQLICPECKNEVDFSGYPNLAVGNVIECNVCGITLLVNKMDENEITCEVVDEGK